MSGSLIKVGVGYNAGGCVVLDQSPSGVAGQADPCGSGDAVGFGKAGGRSKFDGCDVVGSPCHAQGQPHDERGQRLPVFFHSPALSAFAVRFNFQVKEAA